MTRGERWWCSISVPLCPVRRHPLLPSVSSDHQISISSIRQSFIILHIVIQHWEPSVSSSSRQAPVVRGERGQTPGHGDTGTPSRHFSQTSPRWLWISVENSWETAGGERGLRRERQILLLSTECVFVLVLPASRMEYCSAVCSLVCVAGPDTGGNIRGEVALARREQT